MMMNTAAAARDKQDETMEAVPAKCGRQDGSMNIVADKAEAAVAAHKLDEEEIAKDSHKFLKKQKQKQREPRSAQKEKQVQRPQQQRQPQTKERII